MIHSHMSGSLLRVRIAADPAACGELIRAYAFPGKRLGTRR